MVKRPNSWKSRQMPTALLSYHPSLTWLDPKDDRSPWPLGQSPQGFPPYFKGDDGGSTASRKPTTVASHVISHSEWPHTAEDWMDNKSKKIRGINGNKILWTQVELAWEKRLKETWSSWSFWRVSKTRITSRNYWSAVESETSSILRFSSWFRQNDKTT